VPRRAVRSASGALRERRGGDQRRRDDERLRDARVADRIGVGLRAVKNEVDFGGLGVRGESVGNAVQFEPGGEEAGGL
jgi:hypothetical protein